MIFAQQAKGLELSKVQVLSRPIDSAIDPLAITLFIEPLDGDQGVSQERATEKLQQLVACRKPMLLRPIALVARPLFTKVLCFASVLKSGQNCISGSASCVIAQLLSLAISSIYT